MYTNLFDAIRANRQVDSVLLEEFGISEYGGSSRYNSGYFTISTDYPDDVITLVEQIINADTMALHDEHAEEHAGEDL